VSQVNLSGVGSSMMAKLGAEPAATPTPANTAANPPTAAAGDKKITKSFVLSKDSLSEYGEAKFDHETHAEGKYSPDGTSVVGCVECHHTDQPKSALKPPLLTSERNVVLTMETWKASTQKVNECRSCHFQDGNVPDGKTMPTATYSESGKSGLVGNFCPGMKDATNLFTTSLPSSCANPWTT